MYKVDQFGRKAIDLVTTNKSIKTREAFFSSALVQTKFNVLSRPTDKRKKCYPMLRMC